MAYEADRSLNIAAFDVSTACQRLALTAVDASITLVGGGYVCVLDSTSSYAMIRHGSAPVVPASAAAENVGAIIAPGAPFTLRVAPGTVALHALMITPATTGVLYITRVV